MFFVEFDKISFIMVFIYSLFSVRLINHKLKHIELYNITTIFCIQNQIQHLVTPQT